MSINIDKYLSETIGGKFYETLDDNPNLQPAIEFYLESLNTSTYKNIILIDYNISSKFRVIADGNMDFRDRFVFGEKFNPKNLKEWQRVVEEKEGISFRQDKKGFWQTYLYPILNDNNLVAILAIDFSIENFNRIQKNLNLLDKVFYMFFIIIFISMAIIIIFAFSDYKKETKLKIISKDLQLKIEEVQELNNSLEKKVEIKITEIKRSQAYFETIFNTTRDAIAVIDKNTKFLFANKSYFELTNLKNNQLYLKSCYELTLSEDRAYAIRVIEEGMRRGFYYNFQMRYIINDKDIIEVSNDIVAMPDKTSFLLVTRDITVENRLKKEKELQAHKLFQQSRLAQMGEMISMIAHQWRQPLAAIGASSTKLKIKAKMGRSDDNVTVQTVDKIDTLIQHLSQTINDFREFFRTDKIEQNISYTQMIDSVFHIAEETIIRNNIKIIKELNSDDKMYTYVNEVKQVILNLLKNAEDALMDNKPDNPTIKIRTYKNINMVVLEVSDNAGGIPESIIDKIFDPYFSTKKEKNGTGLGLYMSRTIIEEHCGGTLTVENSSDGAVFKIMIKSVRG